MSKNSNKQLNLCLKQSEQHEPWLQGALIVAAELLVNRLHHLPGTRTKTDWKDYSEPSVNHLFRLISTNNLKTATLLLRDREVCLGGRAGSQDSFAHLLRM